MQKPSDADIQLLMHAVYDPVKAHEYYLRTRRLKGRQPGAAPPAPQASKPGATPPPKAPVRTRAALQTPKAKQKVTLQRNITTLETKLHQLETLIQKKEAVLKRDHALAKVRAHKPKDKAQAAQKAKQYRQTHQQQIKAKQAAAKAAKGAGGGKKGSAKTSAPKPDSQKSIAELKALATKVRGLLVVAKQKLAAL